MANYVTDEQCENRRLHCGEAMSKFLERFESKVDPLIVKVTETEMRAKSNTHRLNWAWGILAALIATVAGAVIMAALGG